ncbi:MAG TPA: mechanosensitive ion channel family protein [Candidatus Saccharimonadales bacterium]|nr:mechanosensitive ion channel family protein [Candidatus Saccharimonadales bacterium]
MAQVLASINGAASSVFDNAWVRVALTIAVVIIVQMASRRTIEVIVRRAIRSNRYETQSEERKREDTLINIFRTAVAAALWIIGILVILSDLSVNVAALATGAGLVGVLVGFGAQNTIRDYLAGIFVILENQYRVGDIVSLSGGTTGAGVAGVVEEISIRITRLRDLDGNLHVVRNGEPGVITNLSIKFANVNVDVGVGYDTDIDKAEAVINKVGMEQAGEDKWKHDIIEPIQFLRLDQFADSSIILKSLGKVKPARQWDIAGDFRRRIKRAFDEAGIDIPLPQRVIHEAKPKRKEK